MTKQIKRTAFDSVANATQPQKAQPLLETPYEIGFREGRAKTLKEVKLKYTGSVDMSEYYDWLEAELKKLEGKHGTSN